MNFSISDLIILERLLQNMLNADYEPAVAYILHMVRTEIKQRRTGEFNRTENRGGNVTNAEKIRSLSDEDLAKILDKYSKKLCLASKDCNNCLLPFNDYFCTMTGNWLEWLKQEATE